MYWRQTAEKSEKIGGSWCSSTFIHVAAVQIFKDTVSQAQNWMDTPRLHCAENILVAILIDDLIFTVWTMTIKNVVQAKQFWCRERLACSIIALETVLKGTVAWTGFLPRSAPSKIVI